MKKALIGVFGGLLAFVLILPVFLPSEFNVERTIHIQTGRANVFARIVDLQSWKDWDPWYALEPEAKYTYEGTPGVVGSSTTWDGDKIGSGKQTLTKVVQPEYIETKLEFNNDHATGYWKFTEEDGGTNVIWGMKGELDYPIGRLFGLFMDGMVGKDFEKGLSSLKSLSEGQ